MYCGDFHPLRELICLTADDRKFACIPKISSKQETVQEALVLIFKTLEQDYKAVFSPLPLDTSRCDIWSAFDMAAAEQLPIQIWAASASRDTDGM